MRQKRTREGVNYDHVCILFQCEDYWIRNLEYRAPIADDKVYFQCLRQAHIDATCCKSFLTIGGHWQGIVAKMKRCAPIGNTPPYETWRPMPEINPRWMGVVVDVFCKRRMAKGRLQD